MPLWGNGVLAIWNGIAPQAEADFQNWHIREHIPERLGVPGFLRGRRYVGEDARPRYFNFYETTEPDVLASDAYKARLDQPTEWTRGVVRHFTETSRTICGVTASFGDGEGGWIETVRIFAPAHDAAVAAALAPPLAALVGRPGIVAAHLLQGHQAASRAASAEKAMRAAPDEVVGWIALVEATDRAPLEALRPSFDPETALGAAGVAAALARGIYRLQFALARSPSRM